MKSVATALLLWLFVPAFCYCQNSLNMMELGFFDPPGYSYNDVWGYVDANGNEYAIIGAWSDDIFVIDVTNPNNPVEVAHFFNNSTPGLSMQNSLWRDFKTYNGYLYAVADQGNSSEGLLIFNLNNLPAFITFEAQVTDVFTRAHNIFIDTTSGHLYVAGSNTQNNGLIVYDLSNGNETTPVLLNSTALPGGYIHDVYVRHDTAYCSHGFNGYYIHDFTNPAAPVTLGSINTNGYNHSSWALPSGDYAIVAEEVPMGLPLIFMDISSPDNMNMDTTFQFPLQGTGTFNTPHNPFVQGDLVYVSYYEDGVQVFDISNPPSTHIVGYFDTYPDNTNGYNGYDGCWGVYPFLPSGSILASDTKYGLRILQYTYALPLQLTAFAAEPDQDQSRVLVHWRTEMEEQVAYFELERANQNNQFEVIGKIMPQGGTAPHTYTFIDHHPFPGNNYYRLKIKDLYRQTFSEIDEAYISLQQTLVRPTLLTPASEIQVALPAPASLSLFRSDGSIWWEGRIDRKNEWTVLPVSCQNLSRGMYYLQVRYLDKQETHLLQVW